MYARRQQILPLLCFRIKAMRRGSETNIFLHNNNCTTALSTARCYLESIFLSSRRLFLKISTEMKREDIIQSLMTRKIVIFQEVMNVDYFRYLELAGNFLNFWLCEIQLGAQCLLDEYGPSRIKLILLQLLQSKTEQIEFRGGREIRSNTQNKKEKSQKLTKNKN